MNRRTFEGPMDWEYQNNRGHLDPSSPFSQIPQRSFLGPSFGTSESPSRPGGGGGGGGGSNGRPINPFAAGTASAGTASSQQALRAAAPSPSKQAFPRPPSASMFHAPAATRSFPSASPFRNPAFTTPQRRTEEILSECSGAEESPAGGATASDASTLADDTPDYARKRDDDAYGTTVTPASAVSRKLFSESRRTPGRGDVPRGKLESLFFGRQDRVRKRRRQAGDRDVGSVRSRSQHRSGAAATSSDEEGDDDDDGGTDGSERGRRAGGGGGRHRRKAHGHGGGGGDDDDDDDNAKGGRRRHRRGAVASVFWAIHEHPNVPLILSWWVQLGMNVFFMAVVMWFVWGGISMMRADIAHAADAARGRLLAQMNACAHEYAKNRCAPKAERLPALNVVCGEWEVCMNQDPSSVMKMQVSAKNVAEIINEFVGVMSFKAWAFILSAMLAVVLASNLGFSRFREAAFVNAPQANAGGQHHGYAPAVHGRGAAAAPSLPPSQDPNQAYIWAPIGQTPRRIRREFLPDTPTDTDGGTPEMPRATIMPAPAPPQTPSFRRSPSKGERSPAKAGKSPSKAY